MLKFKKSQSAFIAVIVCFFIGTITQNTIAIKTLEFGGVSTVACGVLLTWIAFAAGDIMTELKGRRFANMMLLFGAAANLAFCGVCAIAVMLPGNNPFIAECFAVVFGSTWRIAVASAVAYIGGGALNNYIMDKMHQHQGESGYTIRAIVSTILGQLVDDYVFIFLAFAPFGISAIENDWRAVLIMPLFSLAAETLTGIISTPLARKVVEYIRVMGVKESAQNS